MSSVRLASGVNKSISLTRHRQYEFGVLGIISERLSDFANCRVDAVLGVNKNILAPQTLDDFLPGDKIPIFAGEQDEQLHRDLFQFDGTAGAEEFVTVAV